MAISIKEVEHIANLASLELSEEEKNLPLAEKKVRADIFRFFGSFGFSQHGTALQKADKKYQPRGPRATKF